MKAYIVLVGTELLNGAMIDTNSIYMAEELNKVGVEIVGKAFVPDREESIKDIIAYGRKISDIIILSGGLGPTEDDITKDAISSYLNRPLVVDDWHRKEMERKFGERNIEILSKNIKEVMVVEGSTVFQNEPGIAPSFFVDNIVAFPGVPAELKNMFPKFLRYLAQKFGLGNNIYIRDILVYGIPESVLEEKVKDLLSGKNFTLEFLVKNYGILIRLLGDNSNREEIDSAVEKTVKILGNNLVSTNGDSVEVCLLKVLDKKGYNIKLAESCTGGMIASTLVGLSGVSKIFDESMVTYSNISKMKRLGVKSETLEKYGAVSEECVREMLLGLDSDTAIAVSGIAGPLGGTDEKPVGTVYIGIRVKDYINIERHNIKGDREKVRIRTTYNSLFNLLNILNNVERGMTKC
jgi:nicotinamide-nucleotide amidase